jgi:hypothetical protein
MSPVAAPVVIYGFDARFSSDRGTLAPAALEKTTKLRFCSGRPGIRAPVTLLLSLVFGGGHNYVLSIGQKERENT